MPDSTSDPLRPLIQRWLQSDDPDRTLEDLCREHPEHAAALREQCGEASASPPAEPTQVGPYRILDTLGEGGMGTVYLAEQRAPVQRRVALKLIKLGMDSVAVVRRFEQERQALALMDHEGIAKVYDVGTSDRGQPYFVMELVKGVPIDKYCEQQRLSLEARLGLMQQVCAAVQHAHQKGVIHRDLKPGNVLVSDLDGRLQIKIIDFGLAKAVGQRLIQESLFTELGVVMGTPEFMAPEQADPSNLDVDTRADVYSLGVMLYQLLVGELPFSGEDLREAGLLGMQRLLREVEPPKPSTKLTRAGPRSTMVAEQLRVSERLLRQALKSDLDWVVLKALEKDRGRRYQSPNAIAEDLQRFLRHEPLLAGPPSAGYRLQKLLRRHRGVVLAAGVVVSTLLVGGVSTYVQWRSAVALAAEKSELAEANRRVAKEMEALAASESRAKAEALAALEDRDAALQKEQAALRAEQQRASELETVARFQQEQFAEIDPAQMGLRLRAALRERVAKRCAARGMDDAATRATLASHDARMRGVDFTGLALGALDESFFEPGLRVLDEAFADQPLLQARLRQAVADTLRALGRWELAGAPQQQATDARRQLLGDEHPDTLRSISCLGDLLYLQGDAAAAEPLLREALERSRRVLGDVHPNTISSVGNLGGFLQSQDRLGEAEPLLREALENSRSLRGADHPFTLAATANLGLLLRAQRKPREAEALLRRALEQSRTVLGDDHPDTLKTAGSLGTLLIEVGNLPAAEELLRDALAGCRRALGDEHPQTLFKVGQLGTLLYRQGRGAEALPLLREAVAGSRRALGDEHQDTLVSVLNLGWLLSEQGDAEAATPLLREAVRGFRRALGDAHPTTLSAINMLGCDLQARRELPEAARLFREAHDGFAKVAGRDHPTTLIVLASLASVLEPQGEVDEAEERYREVLEGFRRALGDEDPDTLQSASNLAEFLVRRDRLAEAAPLLREALAGRRAALGDAHPGTLRAARRCCEVLQRLGRSADARALLTEFLETTELEADHAHVIELKRLLASLPGK